MGRLVKVGSSYAALKEWMREDLLNSLGERCTVIPFVVFCGFIKDPYLLLFILVYLTVDRFS
jgi:hypothetical protein